MLPPPPLLVGTMSTQVVHFMAPNAHPLPPTADRRLFPLFPFDIIVMIIVICFCGSDLQFVAIVLTRHTKTTTWHSLGT